MMRPLFNRLLSGMGAILVTIVVSFFLIHLAPGDPVTTFIDPGMSVADIDRVRQNLGLDRPLYEQLWRWTAHVLQGNWGISATTHQPVTTVLADRLIPTLILTVSTLGCILVLTLILGVISAYAAGSWVDRGIAMMTTLGLAIPSFWLGILLIGWVSVRWNLLPASGYADPLLPVGSWEWTASIAQHLALPLLTGTLGGLAMLTRYYRHGIRKEMGSLYLLAAQARGLPRHRVLAHALKNASLPLVTLLGMELPGLLAGSYMIESVFAWPGLGQLGVTAAFSRDYPVLMGILMLSTLLIVLGNGVSDVLGRWVDPRVRRSS